MRKILLLCMAFVCTLVQAQELSYYLPDSVSYNPAIPRPEEVIGHKVGEWHITHDKLVRYMEALAAAAPERIKLQVTGTTHEGRKQLILIISSPANQRNLENIRQEHLRMTSGELKVNAQMPAVVWMGYSIHGNESSGSNASLLTAYYLAAAQGPQIDDLLQHTVVLLDPSFNPDGLNRFATWANMHKSKNLVTDPNSREFNEVWPGGRFNHYWFDLNRDWLPAQHPESRNRLKIFHDWKPNILTDHHEMGSNSTFFFQPGVPSRVNPLTPARNQELTGIIGRFHAAFLNRIGSLYFTKEGYDDFYYGKGSTYPDVNGGIGILFEQASSRGHAQQTANGILRFPFTIRNQVVTSLSTLEAARQLRMDLLNYQQDFFVQAKQEAAAFPVKAWVFGESSDPARNMHLVEILRRHQIQVFALKQETSAGGTRFEKGAFIVPAAQKQFKLIRAVFQKELQFRDSIFYDVTSWTMPMAFGLPFAELKAGEFNPSLLGDEVTNTGIPDGRVAGGRSEYAYLINWSDFYSPRVLYELLEKGVLVKLATRPFQINTSEGNRNFPAGTLMIPVKLQKMEPGLLLETINRALPATGVQVFGLNGGSALEGVDLGSSKFVSITRPGLAMLVGAGVSATDAGEVWHLLDQRFNIPVSQLETPVFNRVDLGKYNTIIMVSGTYEGLNTEKLKAWVQNGGNLVLLEDALSWASRVGLVSLSFKKGKADADSLARRSYAEKEYRDGAQEMYGAIFRAELDLTHPLGFGYRLPYIDLFKSNKVYPEKSRNPYATPLYYGDAPLQSGYASRENLEKLKHSAAALVFTLGSGRVVALADNPNFRAFWLGGTRLFMNSIFFGKLIEGGSGGE